MLTDARVGPAELRLERAIVEGASSPSISGLSGHLIELQDVVAGGRSRPLDRQDGSPVVDCIPDLDVDRAQSDEFSAQNNIVNAEASLERALDSFKFQLGLPIGTRTTTTQRARPPRDPQ